MKTKVETIKKVGMRKHCNRCLHAVQSLDKQVVLRYHYLFRESFLNPPPPYRRSCSTNFPIGGSGAGSSIDQSGGSGAETVQTPGSPNNTFGRTAAGTVQTQGSSNDPFGGSGTGTIQTPGSPNDPFGGTVATAINTSRSSVDPIGGIGAGTTETPSSSICPIGRNGAGNSQTPSSSSGGSSAGSSCSLVGLYPIALSEMEIDRVQLGRVLYGTLCADAYKLISVMTVLEDDNGVAIRLYIDNVPDSPTKIESLYPKGTKVGIRNPYLMRMPDNWFRIIVENPADIQFLNDYEVQRK